MACIKTTIFVVIINKRPSQFFRAYKGWGRGACYPPTFSGGNWPFELENERYKGHGMIKGLKITRQIVVSHLCFVEDLLFGDWKNMRNGVIYIDLSLLFLGHLGLWWIKWNKFWFIMVGRMKLQGKFVAFFMSPVKALNRVSCTFDTNLNQTDFRWDLMIHKLEKTLSTWQHRWHSLGGRMILLKSVL